MWKVTPKFKIGMTSTNTHSHTQHPNPKINRLFFLWTDLIEEKVKCRFSTHYFLYIFVNFTLLYISQVLHSIYTQWSLTTGNSCNLVIAKNTEDFEIHDMYFVASYTPPYELLTIRNLLQDSHHSPEILLLKLTPANLPLALSVYA